MARTCHLTTRLLAVCLICFPKAALPAVAGVKDTSTSAITTTDVKGGITSAAVPGDLDPTYGNGGKAITPFSTDAFVGSAAVQPDGKLVLVGASDSFLIARYTLNGSLDPTFGTNGIRITPFSIRTRAVAVQPDGKIIVAGSGLGSLPVSFALFRLNPDGSTDNTFGGGLVIINFPSSESQIYDIALQPDGKIVVGGEVSFSNSFGLARLTANGALDPTFGSGGTIMANMGGAATAFAIAVQPDLKVVAVGVVSNDFAVARINPDGQFDQGFGNGGKIITSFSAGQDLAADVVLQPDGKIVAAGHGSFGSGSSPQGVIVRYNSNGTPDGGFGQGGTVTISGASNRSKSLALQNNGKILVAGHVLKPTPFQTDFNVLRLNTDGSPDGSFGTGGTVITDFGAEDTPSALVLQPDGKAIAAGQTLNHATNPVTGGFALARYLLAPADEPVLQTEPFSNHAVALDSVTFRRDPFSIINDNNFSADHHTRVILFAANLTLGSGENFSAVTVQAEDAAGVHNLPVEFVGKMPGFDLLTQVVVRLPDGMVPGHTLVSISFHGTISNKGFIVIQ